MVSEYNKPSQREFYSLKNTHKIPCLGRYESEVMNLEWPTNEDCYCAMKEFAKYYMDGEQLDNWLGIIEDGLKTGRFPPGKGFLHEIDQVIRTSSKASMPNKDEKYQLICTVCI